MIWKLVHWVSRILFVSLIGLFAWRFILKQDAPAQPFTEGEGRLRFSIDPILMWTQNLGGVLALLLGAEDLRRGLHVSLNCMTGLLLCALGVGLLLETSRCVVVSETGIQEVRWLGWKRFIRWEDIEEINIGRRDRLITIRSKDRTKIVYSGRPEHRSQFLYELKRNCGSELPPGFPGESEQESEGR